jgi:hypothetical protein
MTSFSLYLLCVAAVVLAHAAPPVMTQKPKPDIMVTCLDVKNITYVASTLQCSMDVKGVGSTRYVSISGTTIDALAAQTPCDFFPFLVSTNLCAELIQILRDDPN